MGEKQEFASLTSSQVMLMLLVQRPHFKNHCNIFHSEIEYEAEKKSTQNINMCGFFKYV